MKTLKENTWKTKYSYDDGDLVKLFYEPALACAVRYDRSTGYFTANALALASKGLENLLRNEGRMRLLAGCTLNEAEVRAIQKGSNVREALASGLINGIQNVEQAFARDALELLAWMVAKAYLDVKVALPCDDKRRPFAGDRIFHEKAGIIEDAAGNRLAFSGSINETAHGWRRNWESFHVYTAWDGGAKHVDAEEETFQRLWADKAKHALVMDVPMAVRRALLQFLPPDGELPKRLQQAEGDYQSHAGTRAHRDKDQESAPPPPVRDIQDRRKLLWGFIKHAPAFANGGERIGEATSAIDPWPHQIRAFRRMYDNWPPKLLIADEVGLGKTIQAGLLLRQAWLSGKAKRILVLTPKAVINQWQLELREKFNLHWPVYDGKNLCWCPVPARRDKLIRSTSREHWHKEPFVLASSHLMRRADRTHELLEEAAPWDLIVLDEAHHARRKGAGSAAEKGPNQLLGLMQRLCERTRGLLLLTATPMQVSPVEVWDLLSLLGLPPEWDAGSFQRFFEIIRNPSHAEMSRLAGMFRAVERHYGEVSLEDAQRVMAEKSRIKTRKILRGLRDAKSSHPLKQLETKERKAALCLLRANTPVKRLISRNTREVLRRYFRAGKLKMSIAERDVNDEFVEMTPAERSVYEAVEDYISSTYNNAAEKERNSVGFVMTIYRRRLASSFYALAQTLEGRIKKVERQ
ncbi:MAG: DEAD/DEAH box helicase family protein, partial [Gammaproteobacteria bacterium]|nr:DEAD/DEAH box helicase family protein [Gammaproteobacteria bacterium]